MARLLLSGIEIVVTLPPYGSYIHVSTAKSGPICQGLRETV